MLGPLKMVKAGIADAWVASFMDELDFAIYPKWHFDRNKQLVIFSKAANTKFSGMKSLENKKRCLVARLQPG